MQADQMNDNGAFCKADGIRHELESYASDEKREVLSRFFKTGKGQYGEGDKFLGVTVPNARRVAKRHKNEPFEVVGALLQSEWHECRLCALLMLVERFRKGDSAERSAIFDFYLTQTAHINNWDLVDLSAPYIVGEYLRDKPRDTLYRLAESKMLWDNRIAVVSTQTLIRNNDFDDIIRLSEYYLQDDAHLHDLMQKALGWMLREMGKRDKSLLVRFLTKHAARIPRTTLRYAIERFPEDERREFMKR